MDEDCKDIGYKIYIDESGDFGSKEGSSKFFLIAALSTTSQKSLEKKVKKFKAELYNLGWPKHVEIKGTTLWGSKHNSLVPKIISDKSVDILKDIVSSIASGPVKVHYSIARKSRISPHIINSPYGVAYNWLAGMLLARAHAKHLNGPLDIIVDQRSKETHNKMKFDGYVQTKLVCDCNHEHPILIGHEESHVVPGLQAVDFISWGLFRYYEHNDNTFRPLITPVAGYIDDWYSGK